MPALELPHSRRLLEQSIVVSITRPGGSHRAQSHCSAQRVEVIVEQENV
jgi:hypothetical protein